MVIVFIYIPDFLFYRHACARLIGIIHIVIFTSPFVVSLYFFFIRCGFRTLPSYTQTLAFLCISRSKILVFIRNKLHQHILTYCVGLIYVLTDQAVC